MKKKILSAVLALCMVFGSAAALPEGVFSDSASITASAVSTATSGKCGKNVKWSLKNGVLTISGTGKMSDYDYGENKSPFYDREDIKSVVIKSGVTSIGDDAFRFCENLTSITIPSSVTSIGADAFRFCENLTSITIPSSVTSIGDFAFNGCISLKSITIPNSVKNIGKGAFENCTSLTSVTIPNSVKSIGTDAFSETLWLENQQKKNPLVVVNGILIDGKKCSGKVTIPSSVKSIGDEAFFGCENLTSITIPSSVKSIGDEAFLGCENLTSITIANSVTSIGSRAFQDCKGITKITIPNSVTSIGGYAFSGTKWLENQQKKNPLVIVNGILIDGTKCSGKVTITSSVKRINDCAFESCGNLTSVTIPKSVTSIGYAAFVACNSLTSINIPSSVTSIGDYTFDGCTSLKSMTIPNSVTSIGEYAFGHCTSLTSVTIPNSVKSIGRLVFSGCTSLKSVTIPSSVKSIGDYTFYHCVNLKNIIIPKSVRTIGYLAFGYYSNSKTGIFDKIAGFTISSVKGTAAEKYAKENGFKFVARNTTEPKTVRYAGSDRAETATKISKAVNAKTSDTVILATGFDFHDALAAVPLASAYNVPLLLADRDNLSAKTLAEIKRLKAKNVIVVATTTAKDNNGNDAAIKKNVYAQLKTLGVKVTKFDGANYYATAKKVAEALGKKTKAPTSVFITTDKNYADALSASPVAAILGAPILYVDPKATLNATTKNYLANVKKSVQNVYIVGGVNAVSAKVEKAILNTLGKKSATRFAGDNRYETCVKINNAFNSILTGKSVCIAKGYNFPDALAGGVFAAKQKAPLFLADALGGKATISKTQANYLYIKNPSKLYIFGGETAVPTELVKTIAKACV